MEFADDKSVPRSFKAAAHSALLNMFLTAVWQSSKLPFTATTLTFLPSCVHICNFCMDDTPSSG